MFLSLSLPSSLSLKKTAVTVPRSGEGAFPLTVVSTSESFCLFSLNLGEVSEGDRTGAQPCKIVTCRLCWLLVELAWSC